MGLQVNDSTALKHYATYTDRHTLAARDQLLYAGHVLMQKKKNAENRLTHKHL